MERFQAYHWKKFKKSFDPTTECKNVTRKNMKGVVETKEECEQIEWHERLDETLKPANVKDWALETKSEISSLAREITNTQGETTEKAIVYFNKSAEYSIDGIQWDITQHANATSSFLDFDYDLEEDHEWLTDPTDPRWWQNALKREEGHKVVYDTHYNWIWDKEHLNFFEWYWHWYAELGEYWMGEVGRSKGIRTIFGENDHK